VNDVLSVWMKDEETTVATRLATAVSVCPSRDTRGTNSSTLDVDLFIAKNSQGLLEGVSRIQKISQNRLTRPPYKQSICK
jgi:hypothetical protein